MVTHPIHRGLPLAAICVLAAWLPAESAQKRPSHQSLEEVRNRMVEEDVIGAGVTDPRVIRSMRITPRHEFVPATLKDRAYADGSLPIGEHQTISPPGFVAYMTEQLEPQPGDRVLEIGTGSGYQAAVLSPLVKEVYTIEVGRRRKGRVFMSRDGALCAGFAHLAAGALDVPPPRPAFVLVDAY